MAQPAWITYPQIEDLNSGRTTRDANTRLIENLTAMFGTTPNEFLTTSNVTFANVTATGTITANLFSGAGTALTFGSGFNPTFGVVTATTYFGNGSQMSGITGASGGVDNDDDLNLVADKIDDGTGKITLSIGPTDALQVTNDSKVHVLTEMGSDVNAGGFDLINSKTILEQQVITFYRMDVTSGIIDVPNNSSYSELWSGGGTLIMKFKAASAGSSAQGRFYDKISHLNFLDGEWEFGLPFDGGTDAKFLSTGTTIELNKESIVVLRYNSSSTSNNAKLDVDGVSVTLIKTTPTGNVVTDSTQSLRIGGFGGGAVTFDGNIYDVKFLNREITDAEAKSFSSNSQKYLDWIDKGGSKIALNVSNCVNSDYTTFTNVTPTGFDATSNGGSTHNAGTADEIAFIKGKTYLIEFDLNLISGTPPTILLRDNLSGPQISDAAIVSENGGNKIPLVCTSTTIGIAEFQNGFTTASFEVTNLNVHQLGATIVLSGKDFGHITANDSSGNSNDGVVTGAELVNQPEFGEYTDRYKSFAIDNNTFDVPVGTVEMQIIIDVITQEAATTLRIGTTNGGQEIVADVATTTAGLIIATMVLDNIRAGDTLFVGSDGGAAWSTLDFNLYINYKVLENLI